MLPNFRLLQAIQSGCLADFNEAVKDGASPSAKDLNGDHALVVAYKVGNPDLARRLIELGALPDGIIDGRGDHLIHRAARTGNYGFMSVLLEAGVDPNLRGAKQRTALHHSARLGHEYAVRLLLRHKANPSLEDTVSNTPLQLAARDHRNSRNVTAKVLAVSLNRSFDFA